METVRPIEQSTLAPAPSTAAIYGHPIHPMLIPFPFAFLLAALPADFAYIATADPFWGRAALWLIGAGVVTGAIAAVFGLTDFFTIGRVRRYALGWLHFVGNASALALALVNWILRFDAPAAAITPWGVVLTAFVAAILLVTGWAGAELSYRHRIGVTESADLG